MAHDPDVLRGLADKLDFAVAEWPDNRLVLVSFLAHEWRTILAALRSPQGDGAEAIANQEGIPDEASDEAMDVIDQIETALQSNGMLSYAPDGTPCLTWKGRQNLGILVDKALALPQHSLTKNQGGEP